MIVAFSAKKSLHNVLPLKMPDMLLCLEIIIRNIARINTRIACHISVDAQTLN